MRFYRISFLAIATIIAITNLSYAQLQNQVWINEIHYDNVGSDVGEFIEIVVQANFSGVSDIGITLYNGSPTGSLGSYASYDFSDFTKGDTEGSITVYYLDLPANGIQNGAPDGLSLDVDGQLVQFLSYEGTFTASNGPAQGVTSTDIGVEQTGASAGSSVSLSGTGIGYDDFQWTNTDTNSKGSINQNQTIEAVASEIDDPTIQVFVSRVEVGNENTIVFGSTLVDNTSELVLEIKNLGNDTLRISDIGMPGSPFSASSLVDSVLAFNEISEITLSFSPIVAGQFFNDNGIQISSNAVNVPAFNLDLRGEAIDGSGSIPVSQARTLPLGTRVTVSGRVTVANEFGGPLYMQDATAGLAVFWTDLHTAAEIGDSITVTGPLNVFKAGIDGPDSDFLLQISEREDDNDISFQIHNAEKEIPEPKVITVSEMNSGAFESQLVVIQNAEIDVAGVFQANTNYGLSDGTGEAQLRIDNNTDLVGAGAPSEASNVIGVVGRFNGVTQLLPRFVEDLDAEVTVIPGEDVPLDQTFDIVTWNVEWFGNDGNGPSDVNTQFENVKTLITTVDADVYALQEISNETLFDDLVTDLTDYSGIFAGFGQAQNTAYLYKTSTIQRRDARLITTGMNQTDWANGRFPFYFKFNATINNEVREMHVFNIHAKALGEQSDYNQRLNASNQMKSYLDSNHADDNVIFLGDFNDEILISSVGSNPSPYKNFDDDSEYTIVTKSLEEAGFTSFSSSSMIDHIVFSSELSDEYFEGTERVENPLYIGSFLSTTSDHFPVWVRFEWGMGVSNELGEIDQPLSFALEQNYPNPFNPATTINFSLSEAGQVRLSVFDVTGREVAILENGTFKAAGSYAVSFDASQLSSGMYFYQLKTTAGVITRKMMLVK